MLCLLLNEIVARDRQRKRERAQRTQESVQCEEKRSAPPRHRCLPIRILGSWLTTPRPCLCPMWTARDWARPPPWDLRFVIREFRALGSSIPHPCQRAKSCVVPALPKPSTPPPPHAPRNPTFFHQQTPNKRGNHGEWERKKKGPCGWCSSVADLPCVARGKKTLTAVSLLCPDLWGLVLPCYAFVSPSSSSLYASTATHARALKKGLDAAWKRLRDVGWGEAAQRLVERRHW